MIKRINAFWSKEKGEKCWKPQCYWHHNLRKVTHFTALIAVPILKMLTHDYQVQCTQFDFDAINFKQQETNWRRVQEQR